MGDPGSRFQLIQELSSNPDMPLTISELCDMNGVSRSGYYNWLRAESSRQEREEQDRADFELILEVFKKRGVQKGVRSIYMQLLHHDPPVIMNHKKISRLMKKYNLVCTIRSANPYRRMQKALKTSNTADNLVKREFELHGPRSILLTDITYIPYAGTHAYLSTVLDAYTKQILAYVVSSDLKIDFVLETINQLMENHQLTLNDETIIHSDQGSHYTSIKFIELVRNKNLRQSMSRRGNCWDNACQESFFGHMKDEIKDQIDQCQTFEEVSCVIDSWMDYYNNERYQWKLAKLSPNQFYEFVTTGIYPLEGLVTPDVRVGKNEK